MHNTPEEEGTAPSTEPLWEKSRPTTEPLWEKSRRGVGLDVLNPAWRPRTRTYELCRNCGVKYLLHDGQRL